VQYFISVLLIITNSFELVTKYTGITLSFFALMTVAGVFVHRRRFPKANRPYKTWGYPVTPIIFILLIVWSIVYLVREDFILTFIEGKQDAMWMTLMSLLTLVSGALIYRTNRWVVYKRLNYKLSYNRDEH
jgi:APA family basic amino acid/polyamine antiporter